MNEVQRTQLKLLKIVVKVAEEQGIPLWLDGGSLLGAVRHQGFIPWDCDIDVCIPASKFPLLLNQLKTYCKPDTPYLLYYGENGLEYWSNYFADTSLMLDGCYPVKVDLTPVVNVQSGKSADSQFKEKVDLARFFIKGGFKYSSPSKKRIEEFREGSFSMDVSKKTNYLKAFNEEFYQDTRDTIPPNKLTYIYHDALVKKEREYFRYEDVFPLKKIKFEDTYFPVPNKSDAYLTILYGSEFMTPPPVEYQKPQYFNIYRPQKTKDKIKETLDYFLKNEYAYYKARSETNYLKRLIIKLYFNLNLFYNLVRIGELKWIFIKLRFSFKKLFA